MRITNNVTTQNLDYRLHRELYVRLLERLVAAEPRLVFFDLIFISSHPELDGTGIRGTLGAPRGIS